MKTTILKAVLFLFFLSSIPQWVTYAAESPSVVTVKILNTGYKSGIDSDTVSDTAAVTKGLLEIPQSRQFIHQASTLISAKILNPDKDQDLNLDLGYFDSSFRLKNPSEGIYPVEVTMTLRLPDGRRKSVVEELRFNPDEKKELDPAFVSSLGERFSGLVEEEFQEQEKEHGHTFREALQGFAGNYVEMILQNYPRILTQLIEKQKRINKNKPLAAADPIAGPDQPIEFHQQILRREEALETDPSPAYQSTSSFLLVSIDPKVGIQSQVAKVSLSATTEAEAQGGFQTQFDLALDYQHQTSQHYRASLIHSDSILQTEMLKRSKKSLLDPAFENFLAGANSEEEKKFRTLLTQKLEASLLNEITYFPEIFKRGQEAIPKSLPPAPLEMPTAAPIPVAATPAPIPPQSEEKKAAVG